jgi:ketosteroid isomerase-like protein
MSDTAPVSAENVEIVRRMYEANARGDAAAARELLDPEIVVEYRGQLIDKDATYRGHAGVRQLMESILENFDVFRVEVEEYVDRGDDVVVALHQRAVGRASGAPVDIHIGQVWTLRDGRAVLWRIYRSKAEALAAAGTAG